MPPPRQLIDYALARRAVLADVARGGRSRAEVCDAHPDLLRAARYHGEQTDSRCPMCRIEPLTAVTYAYGDELQHASGRARSSRSLDALAVRFENLRIYVVEVCRSCGWNHLSVSFVIGTAGLHTGSPSDPGRRPAQERGEPAARSVPDARLPVRRNSQRSTARR